MISGLMCLAMAVYYEARGESYEGQLAVAEVVLNRVASPRFPGDTCSVVKQDLGPADHDCQFSFYCDGKPERPADMFAWTIAISVAEAAERGEVLGHGALFYHTNSVSPSWSQNMRVVGSVDNHVFFTDEPPLSSIRPRARPENLDAK